LNQLGCEIGKSRRIPQGIPLSMTTLEPSTYPRSRIASRKAPHCAPGVSPSIPDPSHRFRALVERPLRSPSPRNRSSTDASEAIETQRVSVGPAYPLRPSLRAIHLCCQNSGKPVRQTRDRLSEPREVATQQLTTSAERSYRFEAAQCAYV
jgi:hypothetical protein